MAVSSISSRSSNTPRMPSPLRFCFFSSPCFRMYFLICQYISGFAIVFIKRQAYFKTKKMADDSEAVFTKHVHKGMCNIASGNGQMAKSFRPEHKENWVPHPRSEEANGHSLHQCLASTLRNFVESLYECLEASRCLSILTSSRVLEASLAMLRRRYLRHTSVQA